MKYTALGLVILNFVLIYLQPKTPTNSHIPDLTRVMDSHDSQQFRGTLAKILNQIKNNNNEFGYILLGDFLLGYGFCEEAIPIYQEALRRNPNNYDTAIGLAVSLDQLGYFEAAIDAYANAIRCAEEDYHITEAKHRQGELLMRLGKIEQALNLFSELSYAPSLVDLCRIYVYQNEFEQAKKCFDLIVESDTENRSLEVYQLNALASRHFGTYFGKVNPTRLRELIYSDNLTLQVRQALAKRTFRIETHLLYANDLSQLPSILHDTIFFTETDLRKASLDPERQAAGKALYTTSTCIVCHGPSGQGITGPNLTDDYWIIKPVSLSGMFITIRDGRANNTMPGFSQILGPDQIRDLTAYLAHLHRSATRDDKGHSVGKAPQGTKQILNSQP